jgi:hypothetical protein
MISRLLRTPKDVQGDPGGRNPSIGLASRISKALRVPVEALFPDIFTGTTQDMEPRQTDSSHGGGKGGVSSKRAKATQKWAQGAAAEAREKEGTQIYECKEPTDIAGFITEDPDTLAEGVGADWKPSPRFMGGPMISAMEKIARGLKAGQPDTGLTGMDAVQGRFELDDVERELVRPFFKQGPQGIALNKPKFISAFKQLRGMEPSTEYKPPEPAPEAPPPPPPPGRVAPAF